MKYGASVQKREMRETTFATLTWARKKLVDMVMHECIKPLIEEAAENKNMVIVLRPQYVETDMEHQIHVFNEIVKEKHTFMGVETQWPMPGGISPYVMIETLEIEKEILVKEKDKLLQEQKEDRAKIHNRNNRLQTISAVIELHNRKPWYKRLFARKEMMEKINDAIFEGEKREAEC